MSASLPSTSDQWEYQFKLILVGSAGVGKSSLLHRFIEDKFKTDSTHTIGVEFGTKLVSARDKVTRLQIWDTAGEEKYKSVARTYFRGAVGCLLVYDITSRESFNHLNTWLSDARTFSRPEIVTCVIGNKLDMADEKREVTVNEAAQFASENGLLFFETSAATAESVEEAFVTLTRTIISRYEEGLLDPDAFNIEDRTKDKKKKSVKVSGDGGSGGGGGCCG